MRPVIPVAAGCVINAGGEVLICQRPAGKIAAGKWEFPGGKIEAGETSYQALVRELHEELGLHVRAARPLIRVTHDYSDRRVILDTWRVTGCDGLPQAHDQQAFEWVRPADLNGWDLLAADAPIVSALQLPSHYVFTPPRISKTELLRGLQRLPPGALLRLRQPELDDSRYLLLARELIARCDEQKLSLILDRDPQDAVAMGAAGWHATSLGLQALPKRPLPSDFWFAASCHTLDEINHAREIEVDCAVVGAVNSTPSHPGRPGLGWPRFSECAHALSRPAYAIGGLGPADLSESWRHSAQGVAGVSAYWT